MASQWFYQVMGEPVGPISGAELETLAHRGAIQPDTPVRKSPMTEWVPAERVRGLFASVVGTLGSADTTKALPPTPSPESASGPPKTATVKVPADEEFDRTVAAVVESSVQSTKVRLCPFCAETIMAAATKCKHCGEFLDRSAPHNPAKGAESDKRILPLLLLFFFFGAIGGHAFYVGQKFSGCFYLLALPLACVGLAIINIGYDNPLLQLLGVTLGLLLPAVWAIGLIVDLVRIVTGAYRDGNGRPISKWT